MSRHTLKLKNEIQFINSPHNPDMYAKNSCSLVSWFKKKIKYILYHIARFCPVNSHRLSVS